MMSVTDDAKGMIAQEERELRRVFDHVASFKRKKKVSALIASSKERKAQLLAAQNQPEGPSMNKALAQLTPEEIATELRQTTEALDKHTAELSQLQSTSKFIRAEDLYEVIKTLGKRCSKKEVSDMIWEADENLDGCVEWEELKSMFNRTLLDRTQLEPVNLFNVVQFMTYDKKGCGVITADDTMAILFARYGSSQLEDRMKQLFGDRDELKFVDYLERVGKQRRGQQAKG